MSNEVWVIYYRNTDEDFGYSFDNIYVFREESKAKEVTSKLLSSGVDYIISKKCAVLDEIPEYV